MRIVGRCVQKQIRQRVSREVLIVLLRLSYVAYVTFIGTFARPLELACPSTFRRRVWHPARRPPDLLHVVPGTRLTRGTGRELT